MALVPLTAWTDLTPTPAPRTGTKRDGGGKYYTSGDGRRWYYLLVERSDIDLPEAKPKSKAIPLMAEIPLAELGGKLLVCLQKEERLFTVFDSLFEFATFTRHITDPHRCFYEIILGDFPQKPHFDIELSRKDHEAIFDTIDPEMVKDEVIAALLEVMTAHGVELNLERDLLLYASHGKDKLSFHIVVDNHCHCNHVEAKQLYQKVLAKLPAALTSLRPAVLDHAVYSKKQQFRMMGSQKFNSGRKKVFQTHWRFRGREITYRCVEPPENPQHEYLMHLEASLVSNTGMCLMLPSFFEPGDARPDNFEYKEISAETAQRALQLLADYAGMAPDDPRFPYQILDIKGAIIVLKRLRASMCRICSRVHENENPFLFVIEDTVYFHCRRAPGNKKLFVGKLNEGAVKGPTQIVSVATDDTGAGLTKISQAEKTRTEQQVWCQDVLARVQGLAASTTRTVKEPVSLKTERVYHKLRPGELQQVWETSQTVTLPREGINFAAAGAGLDTAWDVTPSRRR